MGGPLFAWQKEDDGNGDDGRFGEAGKRKDKIFCNRIFDLVLDRSDGPSSDPGAWETNPRVAGGLGGSRGLVNEWCPSAPLSAFSQDSILL
jgi:hypothetical protein